MKGVLQAALGADASYRFWQRNLPCLFPFRSCVIDGILIVLGPREGVVGIPEDSVLGVILLEGFGNVTSDKKIFVLFGEVSFSHGSPFTLIFSMNPFLVPVSYECA